MDLTYEEVESLISEVVLGQTIKSVETREGGEVLLAFVHPTRSDSQRAEFYRKRAEDFGKVLGLPSVEAMEGVMARRGFWGEDQEKELKKLKDSLHAQEVLLSKTSKVPLRRQSVAENIERIKSEIFSLHQQKERLLEHTYERRAEEERLLFLTWCCTLNPDTDQRFWPTFDDFKNEKDAVFRKNVALEFTVFSVGLPMKTIRLLARSSQWVIRYLAAQKNGGSLFKREVYDYSIDMTHLMYWSNFYQSLNEMMPEDRPDEIIIENDEALDKYMDDYFKRNKQEAAEARMRKNAGKKSSAWDHSELIVTKGNPVFEDVEFSKTPAQKLREKGDTGTVEIVEKKGR